jgi:hypothetical protein
VRCELEDADGKFVFAAQGDGGRVHDADAIDEESIVGEFGEHLGVWKTSWIAVVDAFDFGRLEESLGLNLHGAKSRCGVCREKRIARASGKNDDIAFVEVAHGAATNVGLRDLAYFERGHDACRDVVFFQGILERQRIDDGREHAHVVALRAIHPGACTFESSEDVAASDDDADLNSPTVKFRNFRSDALQCFEVNAEVAFGAQSLAADLQKDAPVSEVRCGTRRRRNGRVFATLFGRGWERKPQLVMCGLPIPLVLVHHTRCRSRLVSCLQRDRTCIRAEGVGDGVQDGAFGLRKGARQL